MRDRYRFVTFLGVSLGIACLAVTAFALVYLLAGHEQLFRTERRVGRGGLVGRGERGGRSGIGSRVERRFSIFWSAGTRSREAAGGAGSATEEERTVETFHGINLRGAATVHVSAGSPQSLSVRARSGVVSDVVTEVNNGELVVWEKRQAWPPQTIEVNVVMEGLKSLSVSGSGRIQSEGVMPCGELHIAVSGSGSVEAAVEAESIESRVTGSGKLTLSGKANEHRATVSGSGAIKGFDLETEKTAVNATGSGRALVNAAGYLDAVVTGSGSVRYRGDPKVSERVTGSGTVGRAVR